MPDVSTLFELLAAAPRRRLLITLCDTESLHVSDALLTRGEARTAPSGGPSPGGPRSPGDDGRDARELQLYHNHLPKLAAEDVVEWDPDTGIVSRGPAFREVEPMVRLLVDNPQALPGAFV